ncbi:MAG TPA: DUF411 domain-containing protein [Longimicrobiales bacterium]|nr:DUF411 domain-containing protein [Longimicrobiales bacterium]
MQSTIFRRPIVGVSAAALVLVLAACRSEPAPAANAVPAGGEPSAVASATRAGSAALAIADVPDDVITVYMSPTCGCCGKWVEHLRNAGFQVSVTEVMDVRPVKSRYGIAPEHWSCHTATVGDYVIEGHVPAADIARMLTDKPQIRGIAVPGMPIGSPGMEGGQPEPYNVLALHQNGSVSVYASY